ncbi:MAG: hypothetical protein L0Z53_15160, partial [Acidobacteriales bacterium]|nr:hypothetical protein [Terriglobales bacterium]
VQVTINPPAPVTLTLGPTSGMGSAVFTANNCNCTSLTISSSQMVTIKGVTASRTANNMRLSNNRTATNFRDFTVLQIQLLLRTSGTVSVDNRARDLYFGQVGTFALGTFRNANDNLFWHTAVEIVGVIQPSNFTGLTTLRRHLLGAKTFANTTEVDNQVPRDDTTDPIGRDDDPQSGGSQGRVYDLDAPGAGFTSDAPNGLIFRFRANFREWAEVNGVRVSGDMFWFSRVSVERTSAGAVLRTDIGGDNVAGVGSTELTWNLQSSSPPPDPPPPDPEPGPGPGPIIQSASSSKPPN